MSATILFVINTVAGVTGVLGNGLVSLVIIFEKSMHTNTNALILHQAFIDFMGSVFILLHAYIPQVYPVPQNAAGVFVCLFWNSRYFPFTFFTSSTYSLVGITFERFLAIVYPYRYERLFCDKRAVGLTISCVWGIALIIRGYVFLQWSVNEEFLCLLTGTGSGLGVVIFIVQYVLPLTLMSVMYFRIAVELSRIARRVVPTVSDPNPQRRNAEDNSLHRARRNTFKALLIVFVTFVICWSFNQVMFVLHNVGWYVIDTKSAIYVTSVALVAMNACVNPFIYAIKYNKFQRAMRRLYYRGTGRSGDLNFSDENSANNHGSNP